MQVGRAVDALGPQLAKARGSNSGRLGGLSLQYTLVEQWTPKGPQCAMHVGRTVGAMGPEFAMHVGLAMGALGPQFANAVGGRAVDAMGPQVARHVGRAMDTFGPQFAMHVGRALGAVGP